MRDPRLPQCARRTYEALNETAQDRGRCAPSIPTLATRSGQHERSVKRGLRILEQFGYILTQQRYGQTSRYTLFWLWKATNEQGVIARSPNMLVDHDACEGGAKGHESHDSGRLDFSQDGPAPAVELVEQAGADEVASIASSDDAIADTGPGLVEPPGTDELVERPAAPGIFWTREKLYEIGRMRAGPPRPRPGRPARRQKQASFTTLGGELKKRVANAPPGPLPAPAPLIITTADPLDQPATPSEVPKKPQQRGKKTLRGCPPSPASKAFNLWSLPDDDPWLVQQRRALAGAIERGDQERIKFYQSILESNGGNP